MQGGEGAPADAEPLPEVPGAGSFLPASGDGAEPQATTASKGRSGSPTKRTAASRASVPSPLPAAKASGTRA